MWPQYLDKFFPVKITTQSDVLVIDDRRPSDDLALSVLFMALAVFVSAMIFRPLVADGLYWPLAVFLLPALIFSVRSLLLPIREVYVFDKGRDTYRFRRWSVLKRRTTQGSLSQIRAVQIEKQVLRARKGQSRKELFRVALLLHHSLLLGSSDTLVLREDWPLGFSYGSEAQIAFAIANFLNLPTPETITLDI